MYLFGIVLGLLAILIGGRTIYCFKKHGPWPSDIDPDNQWGLFISFGLGSITAGILYIIVSILIL